MKTIKTFDFKKHWYENFDLCSWAFFFFSNSTSMDWNVHELDSISKLKFQFGETEMKLWVDSCFSMT